jgi:hypothetical protein
LKKEKEKKANLKYTKKRIIEKFGVKLRPLGGSVGCSRPGK